MRNRIQGKQLNRDSEHRRAMLRNLAAGLFEHGQIETTMPKAKAVQPFIEKIITIAKKGGLHARRQIEQRLNDRKIHAWVADSNVPDSCKDNPWFDLPAASDIEFNRYGELRKAPRLVQHVMTAVADRFRDRDGGYTRVVRTGRHRLGDGGDIVILQLVGEEEGTQIGGGTSSRRRQADRRTAFAASLRKGGAVAEEAVIEDAGVEEAEAEVAADEATEEAAATDAPDIQKGAEAAAESDEDTAEADDEKKSDE
ncbi:MAG: 50S ribosomal protein L17 [Planctomycetes bacterium]|jgi:large subunit ribosomal protein L17|nr:50S ribosomal protein L17 [Planctomycetota bacterium]MCP4837801.1 50S ribosomal protein L17 [Planctomycetota bacterium]